MAVFVWFLAGLLAAVGAAAYAYALMMLPTDIGFAATIASIIAIGCAVVTVAIGGVVRRLEDILKVLSTPKDVVETTPSSTDTLKRPHPVPPVPDKSDAVTSAKSDTAVANAAPLPVPRAIVKSAPAEQLKAAPSPATENPAKQPHHPEREGFSFRVPGRFMFGKVAVAGGAAAGAIAAAKAVPVEFDAELAIQQAIEDTTVSEILSGASKAGSEGSAVARALARAEPAVMVKDVPEPWPPTAESFEIVEDIPEDKTVKAEVAVRTLDEPESVMATIEKAAIPESSIPESSIPDSWPATDILKANGYKPAFGFEPTIDLEAELDKLIPLHGIKPKPRKDRPVLPVIAPWPAYRSEPVKASNDHEYKPVILPPKAPEIELTVSVLLDPDAAEAAANEAVHRPGPGAKIVGSHERNGVRYTMFSDGTVMSEQGDEAQYFASLDKLRQFMASSSGQGDRKASSKKPRVELL